MILFDIDSKFRISRFWAWALRFRPVRQGKANPNCSDDQGHVAINDAVAKEGLRFHVLKHDHNVLPSASSDGLRQFQIPPVGPTPTARN